MSRERRPWRAETAGMRANRWFLRATEGAHYFFIPVALRATEGAHYSSCPEDMRYIHSATRTHFGEMHPGLA